ncbi:MAG: DUF5058 family protein [Bacillota bacterium]
MEYLRIANSGIMWLSSAVVVAIVVVQSFLFARKSLQAAESVGLSGQQIRSALRSSVISSLGPSVAVAVGAVPLIVAMGAPIAWMRLSIIGSVTYELMAAGFGAKAAGATLGGEGMNAVAFANGVWTMTLGCMGWLLFTAFFTHKMDGFRNALAGGRKALIPIISAAAMLGAFAYLDADRILRWDKGTVACIAGFVIMFVLVTIARKRNIQWLKEWALTISMFGGMLITSIV